MRYNSLRAHGLIVRSAVFLLVTLCLAGAAWAQGTNSGDIRGTVTDPKGAVVPGVKVTVLDVNTGVALEFTTNNAGLYDTVSILPGNYTVTFTKAGFDEYKVDGIVLQAGDPQTVNGRLTVGSTAVTVSVTGETPLLKTESSDQSTSLEEETVKELPSVNRDWSQLTAMLPGSVGSTTGQTGIGVSVNGIMPFEANWLADGGTAINPHSANVDTAMYETVAEVQIETSNYSAEYGTGSVVFNQISKSGTNKWHGSLYEFVENDFFNARSFPTPATTTQAPNLRYDNYGFSVGGPIVKNKAFFFFNYDKIHDSQSNPGQWTVPTDDMRAGDFSGLIAAYNAGATAAKQITGIYEPNTYNADTGTRTQFPGNKIPLADWDAVAKVVQGYFPEPNVPGAYSNNLIGTTTSTSPWTKYFGRADIQFNDSNRLTMSATYQDNLQQSPGGTFPDGPIDSATADVPSYSTQISDVWTISPALLNEARISYHREDAHWSQDDLTGENYPNLLGWTFNQTSNMFPCVKIGGTDAPGNIGCTDTNANYAQNTFSPGDTLSWIHGKHVLHFGGEVLIFMDNDTPWGHIQPGTLAFDGLYTAVSPGATADIGYADFLLGDTQQFSSNNAPINAMREKQPQFFVQDDFKIRPNFTLNLGLRYQILTGWRETHNQLGDFDGSLLNPATNTPGAMWFATNDGRNQLQANVDDIFLPRVGFSWSTFHKLVLRGGVGMFIQPWSEDYYSSNAEGVGASTSCGVSDTTHLTPVFQFSAAAPNLNCAKSSTSPSGYNGQGVNYYPYHTPVATIYQWSLSVQREVTPGMVAEAAFVGNHGTNLPYAGIDINQVPASLLTQSYNDSLGAIVDPNTLRPYPQFKGGINASGGLYNAISNYDSLQLSLRKQFAHGLMFDANYTWSKMLDDQDSSGWSGNGGPTPYQNANSASSNYGLSNQSRAQLFKADSVYDLPFGKGRTFLNQGGPLDYIAGGWQISGKLAFQSGQPFTATMNSSTSGALSGSQYPDLVGNPKLSHPTIQKWFNTDAFTAPTPGTWGNAGRNTLIGPQFFDMDFSMSKGFAIPKLEGGRFQIRLDANNITNHTNYAVPNSSIGSGSEGKITNAVLGANGSPSGRLLQLGGRFSF